MRRKYDLGDAEQAAAYANERLDKLEPKIDGLSSKVSWYSAGIAMLIFLMSQGLIDLRPLIKSPLPDARAEMTHDRP